MLEEALASGEADVMVAAAAALTSSDAASVAATANAKASTRRWVVCHFWLFCLFACWCVHMRTAPTAGECLLLAALPPPSPASFNADLTDLFTSPAPTCPTTCPNMRSGRRGVAARKAALAAEKEAAEVAGRGVDAAAAEETVQALLLSR